MKLEVHPHKSLYNVSQTWRRHISSCPALKTSQYPGLQKKFQVSQSYLSNKQEKCSPISFSSLESWRKQLPTVKENMPVITRDDILSNSFLFHTDLSSFSAHCSSHPKNLPTNAQEQTSCLSFCMQAVKFVLNYLIFFNFLQVLYKLLNILLVGFKPGTSG